MVGRPSPGRLLFEAKVNTANVDRGPLLLIAGGKDHTVPSSVTRATFKLYCKPPAVTEYKEFPDRGHTLPHDSGWREVADATLSWLEEKGL